MDLTIEMNPDQFVIMRNSYTVFDFLSDIGGIYSIFVAIFGSLLTLFNYNHFDTYMASRLFKIQKVDADSHTRFFDKSDFFHPSKVSNVRQCCMDYLPKRVQCCKKNRKEVGIEIARKTMEQETDIIELMKTLRFVKMAFRHLIPANLRMDFKERSRYLCIDPDLVAAETEQAKLNLGDRKVGQLDSN